jgi:hypothetical protein
LIAYAVSMRRVAAVTEAMETATLRCPECGLDTDVRVGVHADYRVHMLHVIECAPGSELAASYQRLLAPSETFEQANERLMCEGRLPLRRPSRFKRWLMGAYLRD